MGEVIKERASMIPSVGHFPLWILFDALRRHSVVLLFIDSSLSFVAFLVCGWGTDADSISNVWKRLLIAPYVTYLRLFLLRSSQRNKTTTAERPTQNFFSAETGESSG